MAVTDIATKSQINTQLHDALALLASDHCWSKTQEFRNMNKDRCIRSRWEKGKGARATVIYLGVNVDSGELVDLRVIKGKYEIETELSAAIAESLFTGEL